MAALDPGLAATPKDRLRHALELIGFSLAIAYAVFLAGSAFERVWFIDSLGRIIDNDFIGVWAAGRLVLEGHPAAAYDWGLHRDIEVAAAGRDFGSYYGWHYPPTVAVRCGAAGDAALSRGLGDVARDHPARLCGGGARHHRRAHRHRAGIGLSRRAVEHLGGPERLSHRRPDRRHVGLPGAAAALRRAVPRAAHLQAAIRPAVSTGPPGRPAVERADRGKPHRGDAGGGIDLGVRPGKLACVLRVDAGDEQRRIRGRPRRPHEAAEPARPRALARRQHDRGLGRPRRADRRRDRPAGLDVAPIDPIRGQGGGVGGSGDAGDALSLHLRFSRAHDTHRVPHEDGTARRLSRF